jgi:hypothetical protein
MRAITPGWPAACLGKRGEEILAAVVKDSANEFSIRGEKLHMKTFVLASLIAASATGCIISSDSSNAHVGATWQVKSVVSNQEIGCPAGIDTAALVNQPVDPNGNDAGSPIIDLFDCAAGAGTSAALPATMYKTWVQLTDHSGSNVYAESVPAYLDVTDVDLTYNTDILDDGGYFGFAWVLTQGGAPIDCASAGVEGSQAGVELTATVAGGSSAATDQFSCDDGQGVTSGFPAGNYTVSIDAFNGNTAVGTADPINSSIQAQNKVTNLGTVSIPLQ